MSLEPQLQCPDGVSYDDDRHTYILDGQPAPSVSALLEIIDPDQYAFIAEDVLAAAAERGHRRHDAIALDLRYDLDYDTLDDDEMRDFEAFIDFCSVTGFKATHSERVVCSRRHRYCGTIDLAGTLVYKGIDGDWLIDLKFTAAKPSMVDLQTAAYLQAAIESIPDFNPKTRRGCLWITKGKWEFFELDGKYDLNLIIAARSIHTRRMKK